MAGELIVVVEDDEKSRKLVRDVLTHANYRLLEADSGEAGVRLAREHHPALIVMDIHLPGIDGIEALHQLRAVSDTRDIPILAVTASAMATERTKIMTAGFDGYESKPISVKRFLAAVREILDRGARK